MKMRRVDWFFVVALLLFAAGLRIIGLTFGQPNPALTPSLAVQNLIPENAALHPDEFLQVQRPLRMLLTGQPNPKFFHTPSFLINANYVTFLLTGAADGLSLDDWEGTSARSQAPFSLYVVGRTYSALMGVLAVAATYAATRRIAGRFAALGAGLLTAAAFTLVQHAHYTTTSSLAAGFAAVAVWASFSSLVDKRLRWQVFVIAGLAAGFAGGNRYNAAPVSIVVFLAGLVLLYRAYNARRARIVLAGWLAFPAAFILSTPYLIFDTAFVIAEIRSISEQYLVGSAGDFSVRFGILFEYRYLALFAIGIPAAVAALLGLYAAWRGRPPRQEFLRRNSWALFVALLLAYLIPYSAVILNTVRPGQSDQLLVVVIPQFAIFAGMGVAWLYAHIPLPKPLLAPGLALLLIAFPLVSSLQFVSLLSAPDTRARLEHWISANLPPGSRVHLNGPYNVALDPQLYPVTQNFGGDLLPLDEVRARGADYVVLSDAWYRDTFRSHEIVPGAYRDELSAYLATYEALTPLARIDSPQWRGSESVMHTASYWHHPGLTIYCLSAAGCATAGQP